VLERTKPARLLSKNDYARRFDRVRRGLAELQARVRDSARSVLIAVEGPDESGKSTIAHRLQETFDPRGFRVWHTYAAEPPELRRPWMWRFWMRLPRRSSIACFDRSWYGRVLVENVEELVSKDELKRSYGEIAAFERMVADDGVIVVKLLMNLSKREQRRRLEACESDPNQSWRIQKGDWRANKKFGDYRKAFETMVRRTSAPRAPWTVIPADDYRTAVILALDAIESAMKRGLR
jgi:polyphosphate kinase 2 (PPK2 family)